MEHESITAQTEVLEVQQCWGLLGQSSVGRMAVTADGRPDVFPVNYKVDDQTLIFRTGNGSKFRAIQSDPRVAIEVDAVSAEFGIAWSVVVKGHAVVEDTSSTLLDTKSRESYPWQGVKKEHFIRITPETVSGRRFTMGGSPIWEAPLDTAIRAGLE